jgi:thiol-disulfide isomerase/thioredoxin
VGARSKARAGGSVPTERPRGGILLVAASIPLLFGTPWTVARPPQESRPGPAGLEEDGGLHRDAPDFELPTWNGKKVRLAGYRGKALLLNFWATWCEPCRVETPWLVKLEKKYGGKGLQVIGIDMDDDRTDVPRFVRQMGIPYPVVLGDDAVSALYGGLKGLPTSIYVDRSGRIVGEIFGLTDEADVESHARKALGLPPLASSPKP